MKPTLGFGFLLLANGTAWAQDQSQPPQNQPQQDQQRHAPRPMVQLRKDLAAAMASAQLTGQQKQTLQNAQASLRETREARRQGQNPDLQAVRLAWRNIRTVAQSGALRPEDRDAIVRDVGNVQAQRLALRRSRQQVQPAQPDPAPRGSAR